jgi:hypothetical protein
MAFVHVRGEHVNILPSDKYLAGYMQDGFGNTFKSLWKLAISIV